MIFYNGNGIYPLDDELYVIDNSLINNDSVSKECWYYEDLFTKGGILNLSNLFSNRLLEYSGSTLYDRYRNIMLMREFVN